MVDFNIKTITPVHIGTGDVYMSSEYFLDNVKIKDKKYPIFNRIDLTKYYSSLDEEEQDRFSKDLLNSKYILPKLSNEFSRYYSFNKCKARPNPGNEIHENIKIMDKPYIPGSSIKGAIENALIYNSLTFEDIEVMFRQGRINDNVIRKFFSPSGNPQNSIMRFLQVSDSTTATRPYIYDIQTIKVDKKGGFSNQMKLFFETIVASKLSASLTTTYDSEIYKKLNLENKKYLLDLDYIKESLYNFAKDYIEFEIDFSEQYGISKSKGFYKALDKKNTIETPLLRLGSTTGILSSAVILKIRLYDSIGYFNEVKKQIRGKKARFEYPVTRRVINTTQYPTGWTQLSFDE